MLFSYWKLIGSGVGLVLIIYLYFDYTSTKDNYAQLQKDYDKTVEAYEHTIKTLEVTNKEEATSRAEKKTVIKAIKKLNILKKKREGKQDVEIKSNDTFINFSF